MPGACGASLVHEASAPADTCSGTGSGGGDGVVDPGEDVVLPVTLRNDGTAALTGIVRDAVHEHAGSDRHAEHGDLPRRDAGRRRPSAPLRTSPSRSERACACGTTIDFARQRRVQPGLLHGHFSVMVGAPGQTTTTYVSPNVPRPLPDTLTTTSTVAVADTAGGAGTWMFRSRSRTPTSRTWTSS